LHFGLIFFEAIVRIPTQLSVVRWETPGLWAGSPQNIPRRSERTCITLV